MASKIGKLESHAIEVAMLCEFMGQQKVADYMAQKLGVSISRICVRTVLRHIKEGDLVVTATMMLKEAEKHPIGKLRIPRFKALVAKEKGGSKPVDGPSSKPIPEPASTPDQIVQHKAMGKLPFYDPSKRVIPLDRPQPPPPPEISVPSRGGTGRKPPSPTLVAERLSLVAQAKKELGMEEE